MTNAIRITDLYYYPIKSCRGIRLEQALVTRRGLQDDRLLMLVDEDGRFVSQREQPPMALIEPELIPANCGDILNLRAPGMESFTTQLRDTGEQRIVAIWRDFCVSVDQGDAAAQWFSDYLGQNVRLVRLDDNHKRRVNANYAVSAEDETSFADGYPVLIISQTSLVDLNSRLVATNSNPLPMDRFRPNIVVSGCEPFAEDGWKRIRIGQGKSHPELAAEFALVKLCARCQITTIDQQTLDTSKEPLATLATYRYKEDRGVMFGHNLIPTRQGSVRVGDRVEILTR